MKMSVFVGTSLDGFIARKDGTYDFLPEGGGEPHGYDEFMASVDTVLIGRKTFETVLAFDEWPYDSKRVVVLSHQALDLSKVRPSNVEHMLGEPGDIAEKLEATGARQVYVDGGDTIQRFLRAGLIDTITITRVPVLIGNGIPLFGSLSRDLKLLHLDTRKYASGLVRSEYQVLR